MDRSAQGQPSAGGRMKRRPPPQPPADDDIVFGDDLAVFDHAEQMMRMSGHALMKNCGVLTTAELDDWLSGANVTRHPSNFIGFEILYGFDEHAQDFVIAKNKNPDGLHFALIANQGA